MSDERTPPRVRANALKAASFVALRDVDPRVVEPLLDSLEDAGVAAYAEPRTSGASYADYVEPKRRRPSLDERLYVDGARRELAEAVVAAELPGLLEELAEPDPDEAFAAIVANWDATVEEVPPWPVTEDLDLPTRPPEELERPVPPAGDPEVWRASENDLLPSLEGEFDPDVDGHYVPPPPPPIPPAQTATKFAIAAIVVGVVCLVGLQGILGFPTGGGAYFFGGLLVVGGIGTLVFRMRDTPRIDDGPDDGAVV